MFVCMFRLSIFNAGCVNKEFEISHEEKQRRILNGTFAMVCCYEKSLKFSMELNFVVYSLVAI